jgi:3-hydroxybutyryl-CoA dehydratase
MGGLWAYLAIEMHFEFLAPVYIGETITAKAEIVESDPGQGWVRIHCQCINEQGEPVLRGETSSYPAKKAQSAV